MNNIYSIEMNIYVYGLCWDLYAKTIHLENKKNPKTIMYSFCENRVSGKWAI